MTTRENDQSEPLCISRDFDVVMNIESGGGASLITLFE